MQISHCQPRGKASKYIAVIVLALAVLVMFENVLMKAECAASEKENAVSMESTIQTPNDDKEETISAKYAIYINWDAFRRDYYDWANEPGQPGTPNLNYLMSRGTYFPNAHNGFPSITNPMQTSIVTGAWPATHGNLYKYYDASENIVIASGRHNDAETIAETASACGLTTASVQQFMLQGRGTSEEDPSHLYIQPGGRFEARVVEATKILKGEQVRTTTGRKVTVTEIPRFLAIYGDDLDAAGHNSSTGYGTPIAMTEEEWKAKMISEVVRMDAGLGDLLDTLFELGIFNDTAIVLTADHGMTLYWGNSSLSQLSNVFTQLGHTCQLLSTNAKASDDTDVVFVSSGQAVQVYFRNPLTQEEYQAVSDAVMKEPYVGGCLFGDALREIGVHPDSGDMVIWPLPPNHFSTKDIPMGVAGNHDTLDQSSRNVFMLVSGAGVVYGGVSDRSVGTIDVAPTISKLLGIRPPANATGQVLEEALAKPAPTNI